jgi:peroxiredoxin Q/BCP
MTDGCTKESCDFRDNIKEFEENNAVILGVNADGLKSHLRFKDKYNLPFTLLSDESKETLKDYGVWQEKSLYGRRYMGIVRTTFVIDEKGKIEKIYEKVKVPGHVEEVLNNL